VSARRILASAERCQPQRH